MTPLSIILILLAAAIVVEVIHTIVFGWLLKEKELDAYLSKYLPFAKLNPFSEKRTLFCDMPNFIALNNSFLSQWYIQDYGCVPRWSKWDKLISEKRRVLLEENPIVPKPPLSLL